MIRTTVVAVLSFALAAGSDVSAQQASEVVACADLAAALRQRESESQRGLAPIDRLARLANAHFRANAPSGADPRELLAVDYYPRRGGLLVTGPRDQVDQVMALVAQLRRPEVRHLRVQCTLLHLPASVGAQHGLAVGRATLVDEVAAGKVQKAAVQARGRLQNLPEVLVAPLVPFHTQLPADGSNACRLRGEAVLVGDDEALFGVQLVAGDLPDDPTRIPKAPLVSATFGCELAAVSCCSRAR